MIVSLYADGTFRRWVNKKELSNSTYRDKVEKEISTLLSRNLHNSMYRSWNLRTHIVKKSSWFLLCREQVELLTSFLKNKKTIEIAAGTGYLAATLRKNGVVDYRAIDVRDDTYYGKKGIDYGIERLDFYSLPLEELHSYECVVATWVPYNTPLGTQIAERMRPGQYLLLQGEGEWGCTGDDDLFDTLDKRFTLIDDLFEEFDQPQWFGIHDRWQLYIKN